jgi:hypothetical protein
MTALAVTNESSLLSMWSCVSRYLVNQKVKSVFKLMLDKATGEYMNFEFYLIRSMK